MGPLTALISCFGNAFRFSGTATRAEFWWSWILLYPVVTGIVFYRSLLSSGWTSDLAATLLLCGLALPMIAVGTRRLADAGVWRWFFVVTLVHGILSQIYYAVDAGLAERLSWTVRDAADGSALLMERRPAPPVLDIIGSYVLPITGRGLALLCLILSVLPTRAASPAVPHGDSRLGGIGG